MLFHRVPLLSQEREKLRFQIWPLHSEGPSEQKPIKNFEERGVWAYPGTALLGTPYYLRNGKSYKLQILHVHLYAQSEQKPIKNFEKSSHERSQGLPKVFWPNLKSVAFPVRGKKII